MKANRVHIATEGREACAICDTETYLQLNRGSFSPNRGFWRRVLKAAEAGALDISTSYLKGSISDIEKITEAEEEALYKAGYESWEMPEEVALRVADKDKELGLSSGDIMDIVIKNRESEGSLCIKDIGRGFQLAEKLSSRRRVGK